MADEFRAEISLELKAGEIDKLKSQLTNIKAEVPVKLKLDNSTLSSIKSQIKSAIGSIKISDLNIAGGNLSINTSSIKSTVTDMNWAYKQMLNIQKNISNIKIKMTGLTDSTNSHQIAQLDSELKQLEADYKTIQTTFNQTNLSKNQWAQLQTVLDNTATKIAEIKAKLADTATNNFMKSMDTDIEKVTSKYDALKTKTTEVVTTMQEFVTAKNNMQLAQQSGDVDQITQAYEKYRIALQNVNAEVNNAYNTQTLEQQKIQLAQSMDIWLQNNSAAAKQFGSKIDELKTRLQNADATSLQGIKSEFQQVQNAAQMAGVATQSFGDRLKSQFAKFSTYLSASMVIMTIIRYLRDAYNNVVEIDSAMTELKKVTDETASSYDNFLASTSQSAQEIGTTVKDLISSTADFARLGYSFEDSQELAKVANIYAVVGDEINSIDDATQSLISTMQAYGYSTSDAMSIVDKFNEVGNNFAISSGGIGEALQRSASSLSAANNTLDESIALIATANTVVQNPEKVGTAFQTISMRIRSAKTELEEAGLETDGMVESTAKLREEIMALSGVDILEADGETFKSTYQILDELSAKWQDLTDIQQASITELLAGRLYQYVQKCA